NTLTVKDWFVIQLGRGVLKDSKQPPKTDSVWRPRGPDGKALALDPRRPLFAQDREPAAADGIVWRPAPRAAEPGPPVFRAADGERVTVVWRPVVTQKKE